MYKCSLPASSHSWTPGSPGSKMEPSGRAGMHTDGPLAWSSDGLGGTTWHCSLWKDSICPRHTASDRESHGIFGIKIYRDLPNQLFEIGLVRRAQSSCQMPWSEMGVPGYRQTGCKGFQEQEDCEASLRSLPLLPPFLVHLPSLSSVQHLLLTCGF